MKVTANLFNRILVTLGFKKHPTVSALQPKLAFYIEAAAHGSHGQIVVTNHAFNLREQPVNFSFVGRREPPPMSLDVIHEIWKQAAAQGYYPIRIDSYGVPTPPGRVAWNALDAAVSKPLSYPNPRYQPGEDGILVDAAASGHREVPVRAFGESEVRSSPYQQQPLSGEALRKLLKDDPYVTWPSSRATGWPEENAKAFAAAIDAAVDEVEGSAPSSRSHDVHTPPPRAVTEDQNYSADPSVFSSNRGTTDTPQD